MRLFVPRVLPGLRRTVPTLALLLGCTGDEHGATPARPAGDVAAPPVQAARGATPTPPPAPVTGPTDGARYLPPAFPVPLRPMGPQDGRAAEVYLAPDAPLPPLLRDALQRGEGPSLQYYIVVGDSASPALMRRAAEQQCLATTWPPGADLSRVLHDTGVGARDRLVRGLPPNERARLTTQCPPDGVASRWFSEVTSNRNRWRRLSRDATARRLPVARIVGADSTAQLWPLASRASWPAPRAR